MGCKGPETFANCPTVRYAEGASWPVKAGHGCIGCAMPAFWDTMSPFYQRLPAVLPFAPDLTVDQIGVAAVAGVAGLTAVHGAASYARQRVLGARARPVAMPSAEAEPVVRPGPALVPEGDGAVAVTRGVGEPMAIALPVADAAPEEVPAGAPEPVAATAGDFAPATVPDPVGAAAGEPADEPLSAEPPPAPAEPPPAPAEPPPVPTEPPPAPPSRAVPSHADSPSEDRP
jgi:hypothetical protein